MLGITLLTGLLKHFEGELVKQAVSGNVARAPGAVGLGPATGRTPLNRTYPTGCLQFDLLSDCVPWPKSGCRWTPESVESSAPRVGDEYGGLIFRYVH